MITDVKVYPVLSSKGKRSILVKISAKSSFFFASIPSGTSTGKREAKELPYKDVLKVLPRVKPNIIGLDESDWITADQILEQIDGSENFANIGGNLALGISIAVARASTNGELWRLNGPKKEYSFPYPMSNMIGGGEHGGNTTWQEFLVIPHRAKDPMEASEINNDIWKVVGEELRERKWLIGRNLENAWMAKLDDLKTLDLMSAVAEDFNVKLGIDFAASSFWNGKGYKYRHLKKPLSREKHMEAVKDVIKVYNLYYVEDPFHEDDFEAFAELNKFMKKGLLAGDDIYCTNLRRVQTGVDIKASNSVIIKPNQSGSVYRTDKVVDFMHKNGMVPVVSHRSGETEDHCISDFAILWKAPIIKISNMGADTPKHNRLFELWHDVPDAKMAELP